MILMSKSAGFAKVCGKLVANENTISLFRTGETESGVIWVDSVFMALVPNDKLLETTSPLISMARV